LPFVQIARLISINAENIFNAATCQFSERNLAALTKLLGTGVEVVRQLNLSSDHDGILTALCAMSICCIEDFVEAIRDGREPRSGIDLAVECVNVINAAYQSAETGYRVTLT